MVNILFHSLPGTVVVGDKDYEIVTDFREWIKLSELLRNIERFDRRILNMILEWYVDERPEDEVAAVYALQKFLSADAIYPAEESSEECEDQGEARTQDKDAFSFEQDAICIYSAFMQVYGIDLESIPYMHWWKFLVLFTGLPADTEIKERIYYRTVDLNTIKEKEERKRIKEIRKKIALKRPKHKMSDYQIGDVFG